MLLGVILLRYHFLPSQDRRYAEAIMDNTLLAAYQDTDEQLSDSNCSARKAQAIELKERAVTRINTHWRKKRVGHICVKDSKGKPCCTSRCYRLIPVVCGKCFMSVA